MARRSVRAFIDLVSAVDVDEDDPIFARLLHKHLNGLGPEQRDYHLHKIAQHLRTRKPHSTGLQYLTKGICEEASGESRRLLNAPNSRTSQVLKDPPRATKARSQSGRRG